MFDAISDFISEQQGDSAEFIEKSRALAIGVTHGYEPKRLYLVRIDNWFGPKWMHFAGKVSTGKHFYLGLHKTVLHVPPFVPHRVLAERVLAGPDYQKIVETSPLHIDCSSHDALLRRIRDIDREAVFVWFSGESEAQQRGAVMVYLPVASAPPAYRHVRLRRGIAFYAGFSWRETGWEPAMLRGISRAEVDHIEASGRVLVSA